jgi:hypothetical protein
MWETTTWGGICRRSSMTKRTSLGLCIDLIRCSAPTPPPHDGVISHHCHHETQECSGVLIIGRSRADATHFTSLFKNKHVTKQYWAVLAGVPNPRSGR